MSITLGMDGGSAEGGTVEEGGSPTADLLMGFLSDFRSTSAPTQSPEPKRPATRLADTSPPEENVAVAVPAGEVATAWEQSPTEHVAWQPPAAWRPPALQPPQPSAAPPGYWQPAVQSQSASGTEWQPPRSGGPRRTVVAVVAVVAALAVLGAGVVFVVKKRSGQGSYPAAWDPRVAPIASFVASQRGLSWKHPVRVEFLTPTRFSALMAKESAPDAKSSSQAQPIFEAMRAVGVASGNDNLAKSAQQFAQSDVVGQYVYSDRTVYVSGDQLTPFVRSTLAHELTHALQAQYFDLQKIASGHADDDSAVTALIEGDAVRVQNAYEQTLSEADQNLLVQEEQQGSSQAGAQNTRDGIPQFLVDQSEFPYDFGPTFVQSLVSSGGNHAVDAAFKNPPTLDSQIVDPETYIPGAPTPKVNLPSLPKGAHQAFPPSGFGEVALLEMLGDRMGFGPAWTAIQGWTADQFVAYRVNGQLCVNVAVLNDSPDSASSLLQAGKAWAAHLPSAAVNGSGSTVNFHACDPGPSWKPSAQPDDPYQALAVRSVLMYQLMSDGHLSSTKAVCAADQVMTTLGPTKLESAEQSSDPGAPAVQALGVAVEGAVAGCS